MTSYEIWIEPEVHHVRESLPGNFRQQIKRIINELANNPRPAKSRALDMTEINVPAEVEVRRFSLIPWRIIYAMNDQEQWVWVLAIRRRPPYNYEDLEELIGKLK